MGRAARALPGRRAHLLRHRIPGRILAGPGLVLVAGTVGAFVATYRAWQRRRAWPIWQGAGWFMMTVSLGYLAIGAGTVMT